MSDYSIKLRHIMPTFLCISLGSLLSLALIRYYFAIQSEILHFKMEVWEKFLPFVLPWIVIIIWLRPKLRILTFEESGDRRRLFFYLLAWGTMFAPLSISQSYLTTSTGSLKEISSISETDSIRSNYFTIKNFSIKKEFQSSFTMMTESGGRRNYNEQLTITIYFVWPITDNDANILLDNYRHWYGMKFQQQMSNNLSSKEKSNRYDNFYNQCLWNLRGHNFQNVTYFERLSNSEDKDSFTEAVRYAKGPHRDPEIFIPRKENFESRSGDKFEWIFGSYAIGVVVFLIFLVWPGYSKSELERQLTGKKN